MDHQIQRLSLTPIILSLHAELFWYFNTSGFYAICMHVQIHLSELIIIIIIIIIIMLFVQPGDCRAGTGQRATSILAGIIKCQHNHVRGFHDYCLRAMFLHPCEIQLS